MKKILLFHIFPINNWKEVTEKLISNVTHEDIFVHVSMPRQSEQSQVVLTHYLLQHYQKIKEIFFSPNSDQPEVDAWYAFRNNIPFAHYDILSYMHTKGVTKSESKNVADWVELMRYFIIDKMADCESAFSKGYILYGVNRTKEWSWPGVNFFYAGNFVSLRLTASIIEKISKTDLVQDYHGLEGFWGKLCETKYAYCAFHSRIDHYTNPFPPSLYKNSLNRFRYSVVSYLYQQYYRLKISIMG